MQRRRLGLLALLSVAGRRGLTRDKLIGYLWPDANPDRARHLLSDSVYRINQAVGGDALIATGDELRLNPLRLPSDAWEFIEALERGDWEHAVELHSAPFLDGFFLTDADELERWVDAQRERLARERARALEALAHAAEHDDAHSDAARWWRLLAEQDPLSSRIALRLMRALDRTGDRAAALQLARTHTLLLQEELGVAPDADLIAFATELRTPNRDMPDRDMAARDMPARDMADRDMADRDMPDRDRVVTADHDSAPPRSARRTRHIAAVGLGLVLLVIAAIVSRQGVRVRADADTPAIAVLPFADLSADGEYEYFADGITEELMVRLAQVDGLSVVGRTSAFALKGRDLDVREIAARLNVTTVLEGSVRHSGDSLRIVAQLIDARNGYQLWTETYDREIEDVFAIQEEIARQIVTRLGRRLTGADESRLAGRVGATDDPEAFNLYLKGRYEWHRRTEQSLLSAAAFFRDAVERAPDYAQAHAGLGDAYAVLGFYDYLPPREAFPAAAVAARRALELEPSLAQPHATLAYVALYHEWDWARAEREFQRAIELDPRYSTAHQWYANFLTAMGRFDEATAEMGEAMNLDPLSLIANAALGWVLYHSGDYDRAIAQCTRALELDPDFALAYLWRGMALEERGDMAAALLDLENAVRLTDGSAINVAALARARARAGHRDQAVALMQQLEQREETGYVPPYETAKVYEALGDTDAALRMLERAYEHRSHSMAFLAVDPQLEQLRGDARFRSLVVRVGLDPAPAERAPAGSRWR